MYEVTDLPFYNQALKVVDLEQVGKSLKIEIKDRHPRESGIDVS